MLTEGMTMTARLGDVPRNKPQALGDLRPVAASPELRRPARTYQSITTLPELPDFIASKPEM
jgi:hypothetical protein